MAYDNIVLPPHDCELPDPTVDGVGGGSTWRCLDCGDLWWLYGTQWLRHPENWLEMDEIGDDPPWKWICLFGLAVIAFLVLAAVI